MPELQQALANAKIAIIGLGYVGLPLALAFGQLRPTLGFDIDKNRVHELKAGRDSSRECSPQDLAAARQLTFSSQPDELVDCQIFVIAVPTPINSHKRPDLSHLQSASELVGRALKPGDLVIFEATVYPGCTEEICVPILERLSGLQCAIEPTERAINPTKAFHLGYSPERINPGDIAHSLRNVVKITAGATPEAAETVDQFYKQIVQAGTHKASSIRVAEAAKVIENTQRDLNIALVNELALIFNRLGIDTQQVLEAAGTKWNFLPFRPGLVGGHCIGVDPYYLTHKAEEIGHHPEVILAGRRINDAMGQYVAQQVIRLLAHTGKPLKGARCLVLGLTFKENCADIRNTRAVDIIHELQSYGVEVDVYDPWVEADRAEKELALTMLTEPQPNQYNAIVLAVAHQEFHYGGMAQIRRWAKTDGIIYDVKGVLPEAQVHGRL